jgi:Glycosyl transferase family 2
MLFTASTVKDTLPNLQRFVTGNLAGGIDHLIVFLDDAGATDPEARELLEGHPSVTCVATDEQWWQGDRPGQLNVRQRINANLAKAVLTRFEHAEWVFHIDADEIAQVDRAALAAAPPQARVVRLAPLEAVAQREWTHDPTLFKRLLDQDDLTLLQTLGVIDRAHNGAYFHGHVDGKSGVRPTLDLWLTLHHVVDAAKDEQPPWEHPGLRLLHYESFSGEDFVRKWTSILAAGPTVNFRPAREPTAIALRTLIAKGLSAEQARPYLMRIFERTTQDDLTTLRDLGLLDEIDATAGGHRPQPFPEGDAAQLTAALDALATAPKRGFHPGRPADDVRRLLDARLGEGPAGLRAGRRPLRRS